MTEKEKKKILEGEIISEKEGENSEESLAQKAMVDLQDQMDLLENLLPVVSKSTDLVTTESLPDGVDPLKQYLRDSSRYKVLSLEEEKELVEELQRTGDIEVARKLVLANLRLVVKIAMEYRNAYRNVMDLIQEGNMGLMKAVSKYNPDKGAKLSYYSSWWIRSYILKFILDNFRLIKIGTTAEQRSEERR